MSVKAIIIANTAEADAGTHEPRPDATTEGTTQSANTLWTSAEGITAGLWEVTPGVFPGVRSGYHETCHIISGRATITEEDGTEFEIGPGSFFITPEGWKGTWTVHETLRKSWTIMPFTALANPTSS